jgi:hypothetical protein
MKSFNDPEVGEIQSLLEVKRYAKILECLIL